MTTRQQAAPPPKYPTRKTMTCTDGLMMEAHTPPKSTPQYCGVKWVPGGSKPAQAPLTSQ
jgi:hypothetical protein